MAKVSDVTFTQAMPIGAVGNQVNQQDSANGFSEIMKQASEAGKQSQNDLMNLTKGTSDQSKNDTQVKDSRQSRSDNDASLRAKKENVQKQTDTQKSETVKKTNASGEVKDTEKIAAAEQEVLKETAESLNVTVEELLQIMENLGLTVADLMQPGNMAQVLAVTEEVSPADIVLSEDLTGQVLAISEQVTDTLQEAADALGMSMEELTDAIKEQAQSVSSEPAETEPTQEFVQVVSASTEKEAVKDAEPVSEESVDQSIDQAAQVQKETVKETTHTESGNTKERSSDQKKQTADAAPQQAGVQNQQVSSEQPVQTTGVADRLEQSLNAQRTQQVIDQIAEHVKTNGGGKLNGIEMMLNPANLGSIRLQLESDNGVIRGQLTASDEAVRAALESQLTQLRDALVEQGMKVDAIEVTVAGHELEQNLDQSGEQAEQQAQEMAGRRNARRILDLNEIDGEEAIEEMSDAEKLEVEMMRMGGNRLNFQA